MGGGWVGLAGWRSGWHHWSGGQAGKIRILPSAYSQPMRGQLPHNSPSHHTGSFLWSIIAILAAAIGIPPMTMPSHLSLPCPALFDHLTWLSHAQGKLIKSVRADLILQEISHYMTGNVCIPQHTLASFSVLQRAFFWYERRYWVPLSKLHNYIDLLCVLHVRFAGDYINAIFRHSTACQVQLEITKERPEQTTVYIHVILWQENTFRFARDCFICR